MLRLTREVRFSVDRDWAGHIDPGAAITNSWGGWPSAVGLVPFLVLRVTVSGTPDPVSGYLCNISMLDRLLRTHAVPHTAERLAECGWRIGAERLLKELWPRVAANLPPRTALERLELAATPYLRFGIDRESPHMVTLTQQFEFSAAHRLDCPSLSAEENRALFGKCNHANGHGHNYVVEVTVSGTTGGRTGAVVPLPQMERAVRERVIDRFDHRHLNLDLPEFRELNPSVENIAAVIWRLLDGAFGPASLHAVRVYETPKTWAEVRGEAETESEK